MVLLCCGGTANSEKSLYVIVYVGFFRKKKNQPNAWYRRAGAVLFPSGLVLFFLQYALGPGLGLALMMVGMGVLHVAELPNLLPLNTPSAAKDKV
jgi:hypothetical protein